MDILHFHNFYLAISHVSRKLTIDMTTKEQEAKEATMKAVTKLRDLQEQHRVEMLKMQAQRGKLEAGLKQTGDGTGNAIIIYISVALRNKTDTVIQTTDS